MVPSTVDFVRDRKAATVVVSVGGGADADTDSISGALAILASIAPGGGVIYLREGSFPFTPTGPLPANLRIVGSGRGATTIVLGGALTFGPNNALEALTITGAFTITLASDYRQDRCTITSPVVVPSTAARVILENSRYSGINARQIDVLAGASTVVVQSCEFGGYTSEAIRIAAVEGVYSGNNLLGGGTAPRAFDVVAGGDRNIFVGNRSTGHTSEDYRIAGVNNLLYASREANVTEVAGASSNRYSQLPGFSQSTLLGVRTLIAEAQRFLFYADQLDNPVNADWAVNALAPASADSLNSGLTVRRFDDTLEEGVGFILSTLPLSGQLRISFKHRAQTAPGAPAAVQLKLYVRRIPNNAAPAAWSAGLLLTLLPIPASTSWQYASQYIPFSALGITGEESELYQFELTRVGTEVGDTLTGDWCLLELGVEVF